VIRRRRPVVGITGAHDGLGRLLLDRLTGRDDLGEVRAIDRVPAGIDTVVHLATTYDARLDAAQRRTTNVAGTRRVLEAARSAGARRVVLVTSAQVYGAAASNPVPLPDEAPINAPAGDDLLGDHVVMEGLAAGCGLPVAVLRPASLVGGSLGPAYDGALVRHLTAPRLLAARGSEPLWQLCHVDDLVAALEVTVAAGLTGPLPVGCEGAIPQTTVERLAGKRRVELPTAVALSTAERLHRLGVSSSSPRDLDYLLGPVVVGSSRLRAAGWTPAWSNEAALRAHVADRAKGRGGAYTAAGATVAVLGTAALVRQARRRRRR
jgi:nucleoside-diphosphate-sugar epimerase